MKYKETVLYYLFKWFFLAILLRLNVSNNKSTLIFIQRHKRMKSIKPLLRLSIFCYWLYRKWAPTIRILNNAHAYWNRINEWLKMSSKIPRKGKLMFLSLLEWKLFSEECLWIILFIFVSALAIQARKKRSKAKTRFKTDEKKRDSRGS